MTDGAIFTIGHSTHPEARFVAMLLKHHVTAVADVRSSPYSRFNPQFNRKDLAKSLKQQGIRYIFLGRELGGRSEQDAHYDQGRIRYDWVARTERFRSGLARLTRGAKTHRIALMCSEGEPLDCHRTLLVAHALEGQGLTVQHILTNGSVESHSDAMSRLLAQFGMDCDGDLLTSREDAVAVAIDRQAGRVGHIRQQASTQPAQQTP